MILKGDCIEIMKAMKPNSVDAICTDPPYGLEFMGKEWDKLIPDSRLSHCVPEKMLPIDGGKEFDARLHRLPKGNNPANPKCLKCGHYKWSGTPCKCKTPIWSDTLTSYNKKMQLWHTQWLIEAYRVLKPGGSMLVMGGTRTSHRLACAIEDSGFIIKDTLMWIYGSGFPKAQDLGKMIKKRNGNGNAKHWDGFKVGTVKPAYEPIIWAVKPPEGSYIDNVLKWGVGAVNVEATRIGLTTYDHEEYIPNRVGYKDGINHKQPSSENNIFGSGKIGAEMQMFNNKGRFPANIILSHHPECVQVGVKKVDSGRSEKPSDCDVKGNTSFDCMRGNRPPRGYGIEQVESWNCHPDCAVRMLDEQSGLLKSEGGDKGGRNETAFFGSGSNIRGLNYVPDSGGASRFFYCAKASRAERNAGLERMEEKPIEGRDEGQNKLNVPYKHRITPIKNSHPTVKPIKLFEWLIKLVTREGQVVLDPFIGSGTTAIACHNAERKCVGIDKEDGYLEIAIRRIAHWQNQPKQGSLNYGEMR